MILVRYFLNVSLVVYFGLPTGLLRGSHAGRTFDGRRHGGIRTMRPTKVSHLLAIIVLIVGML